MARILGVIPARYGSTRFPGKPLVKIQGIPMIVRVWQQANQCPLLTDLVVATDDDRIAAIVTENGGKSILTRSDHPSGTDRLIEVAGKMPDYDFYLNIQGDEPFLDPDTLTSLISALNNPQSADIATPICRITEGDKLFSPNTVKVVLDSRRLALYFSRQPIPYLRNYPDPHLWLEHFSYWQHIGVYGFRKKALEAIAHLPPGNLEQAESLEQLRWLEAGLTIMTCEVSTPGIAIDTPEDLEKIPPA